MNIRGIPQLLARFRHLILGYGGLLVLNVVLFSWTSPLESPAWVVIAGFAVAAVDIVVVLRLFVRFLCTVAPRVAPFRRRIVGALASLGIVALALASLGQLTWRDMVVVLIIWLLGYLYSLRFRFGAPRTQ